MADKREIERIVSVLRDERERSSMRIWVPENPNLARPGIEVTPEDQAGGPDITFSEGGKALVSVEITGVYETDPKNPKLNSIGWFVTKNQFEEHLAAYASSSWILIPPKGSLRPEDFDSLAAEIERNDTRPAPADGELLALRIDRPVVVQNRGSSPGKRVWGLYNPPTAPPEISEAVGFDAFIFHRGHPNDAMTWPATADGRSKFALRISEAMKGSKAKEQRDVLLFEEYRARRTASSASVEIVAITLDQAFDLDEQRRRAFTKALSHGYRKFSSGKWAECHVLLIDWRGMRLADYRHVPVFDLIDRAFLSTLLPGIDAAEAVRPIHRIDVIVSNRGAPAAQNLAVINAYSAP